MNKEKYEEAIRLQEINISGEWLGFDAEASEQYEKLLESGNYAGELHTNSIALYLSDEEALEYQQCLVEQLDLAERFKQLDKRSAELLDSQDGLRQKIADYQARFVSENQDEVNSILNGLSEREQQRNVVDGDVNELD